MTTAPHRLAVGLVAGARRGPFAGAFAGLASMHRTRVAVVDDHGSLTYGELEIQSSRLADLLAARGVGHGAGLGIMCRNSAEMVVVLAAGAKVGATLVLLNAEFSGPQLADVCRREGVDFLVHDEEFLPAAGFTDTRLGALRTRCSTPGASDDNVAATTQSDQPRVSWSLAGPRLVLLTSGTTGTPKGAPRDSGVSSPTLTPLAGMLAAIPYRRRSTVLIAPPFFHAWGLVNLALALGMGSTVVTRAAGTADAALLRKHEVDTLVTVPTLLARTIAGLAPSSVPRSVRLVVTSGSALPVPVAVEAGRLLGNVVHNLYGSTEVGYVAIAGPEHLKVRRGTVGLPPLGVEVRILDDAGEPVPAGTVGRVFARTGIGFSGYTGGGTKESVDGLLSTGDLGRLDADGFLFIEGRDDDMIVSGGENVFPAEVDDCLLEHPAVVDAVTIGVADEEFGQRLRSFVVASGSDCTADELRGHVRDRLARFKVPREVVFVPEIPRNPAGKVVKRQLPG